MSTPTASSLPDLTSALAAINNGETTALALINQYFDRIDAREADVGAWQFRLSREEYLAQYQQQRGFYEASLLKGLPVAIKDIIDTASMPTEMGSPIHKGRMPAEDATCVELLKRAGAIVLGKTVTTEFAYFKPGKTRNPADLNRTPGGSSSGSAAAVADGMVPMALGSQTAASVIRPAAYCGTLGYVGSRGEYSLRGGQPLAQSLDSLGLFARQVSDLQLMRAVLLRSPVSELTSIKPRRIVVCRGDQVGETDPAMAAAIERVCEILRQQDIEVVTLDDQHRIQQLVTHHGQIMAWEVCRNLARESRYTDLLSAPLQALMETGLTMPREEYLQSLEAADANRDWLWQTCAEADAILAPAAPGVAPLGHDKTGAPHMSRPWQAMGLPVITLPGQTDEAGLPLGIQLIGRARADDRLLAVARWLQPLL